MTFLRSTWLPLLLGLVVAAQFSGGMVTRLIVRDEIIWRVPVVPLQREPDIAWQSKRGPKCIAASSLSAAAIADDSSVDFLLRNRTRLRASLDNDCPTLDFYGGFYLQSDDEKVCAGRDEIRNRMGGTCRIQGFKLMVPTASK